MSDLKWQVKVLRELLAEAEKRMNEKESQANGTVNITRACIAERRDGATVCLHRFAVGSLDEFAYQIDDDFCAVNSAGRFHSNIKFDEDIVRVVRSLTEKEILEFQVNGIVPSN